MRFLITAVRATAIVLGAFWLLSSLLDVLGILPYSTETPPVAQRLAHSIPSISAGALLVLPYRFFRPGRIRIVIHCGLFLVVAWVLYLSAGAVSGYFTGQKSWHAVPAAILLTSIAVGNLWACLRITGGERPVRA